MVAGCGPKTPTFLQLLKETALRVGEANMLRWSDINFESGTVRITPEKNSEQGSTMSASSTAPSFSESESDSGAGVSESGAGGI